MVFFLFLDKLIYLTSALLKLLLKPLYPLLCLKIVNLAVVVSASLSKNTGSLSTRQLIICVAARGIVDFCPFLQLGQFDLLLAPELECSLLSIIALFYVQEEVLELFILLVVGIILVTLMSPFLVVPVVSTGLLIAKFNLWLTRSLICLHGLFHQGLDLLWRMHYDCLLILHHVLEDLFSIEINY